MPASRLQRIYRIQGLDRILYSRPPSWAEGTFVNLSEEEGELTLHRDGITTRPYLESAIADMDAMAQRFHLYLLYRFGSRVTLDLLRSDEPDVDPHGTISIHARLGISDTCKVTVLPKEPPAELPQMSDQAARWVYTIAEVRMLDRFPDEAMKRLYLIIEELWPDFERTATSEQRQNKLIAQNIRDFVSHPVCNKQRVVDFVSTQFPNAVISTDPLTVRFDRTSVEHRNFIGRHQPIVEGLARMLIDQAMAML